MCARGAAPSLRPTFHLLVAVTDPGALSGRDVDILMVGFKKKGWRSRPGRMAAGHIRTHRSGFCPRLWSGLSTEVQGLGDLRTK